MTSIKLKKTHLSKLISEIIQEVLNEYSSSGHGLFGPADKPQYKLFRRSSRHPAELQKQQLGKAYRPSLGAVLADPSQWHTWFTGDYSGSGNKQHYQQPYFTPSITRYSQQYQNNTDTGYHLPDNLRDYLNSTLYKYLYKNPISNKVTKGITISKREASELAKTLMSLKGFTIQQPRKLAYLLILLAIDNNN